MPIETEQEARDRLNFKVPESVNRETRYADGFDRSPIGEDGQCVVSLQYHCDEPKYFIGDDQNRYDNGIPTSLKNIEWPHSIFFCYIGVTNQGSFNTSIFKMEWVPQNKNREIKLGNYDESNDEEIAYYIQKTSNSC